MEDAMALLQTGKRLASAAFRRESICWSDDSFSFSAETFSDGYHPQTPPRTESESIGHLLGHIKLLVRRKTAAMAALEAGLYSEAIRHFSKIVDGRRGAPQGFLAECYMYRATAYQSCNRIAEAIADCNRTLALEPSCIEALSTRASLFESIRCLPDSLHDLEHLKLLYNSILRDRKLQGPAWKRQSVRYREIPGKLCSLGSKSQELKQRIASGETGNVDYYSLIGLRRGCSRSELERAHLLLILRHKPDKSTGFIDRCEFADELDIDSIRDRAKMSALLLYRLIQRGYSNVMNIILAEEAAENDRKKASAALQQMVHDHQEPSKIEPTIEDNKKSTPVYQGVFCRDIAVVGNLLSQAGFNRYQPAKFLLLIHHGASFRKFLNHEYQEGKTDMFDFVDIYCFSVHKLDIMVLQLGYDGINKPMCYQYLSSMTDLDVGLLALGLDEDVHSLTSLICNLKVIEVFIEHGITKLNCYYMSSSLIRVTIEEYQEDMVVEASSVSPKKNELLMLKCVNEDTRHSNTTRVDEHLNNDNVPLENAALIGKDIHNDVNPQDCEYDSTQVKIKKQRMMMMIDEENKIYEAEVEVHLFSLEESDYQFTNIGVSSEVPDNVFMENDRYEMDIDDFDIVSGGEGDFPGGMKMHLISSKRLLGKVKVMEANMFSIVVKFLLAQRKSKIRKIKARTYNFLAKKILDQIKVNLGIPLKAVQDILQRELEVHVSMSKDFRAKEKENKEIKAKVGRAHIYILLNNLCEVFNGKVVGGRDKSVITLLEYIREYCMKRIVNVKAVIDKCDGPLTPTATIILDSIKKEATYMTVQLNSKIKHQVSRSFDDQCVVDVSNETCTCRKLEIIRILCKHAVATN
uniref:SWIM-type domain-containing protein n=1 Tax=Tanacetum cinerariifolium TaxID=118510 RepID=A0A6L2JQD0_TANCI|nr:hypothetical protein [Tanacetum cinerariifolium]